MGYRYVTLAQNQIKWPTNKIKFSLLLEPWINQTHEQGTMSVCSSQKCPRRTSRQCGLGMKITRPLLRCEQRYWSLRQSLITEIRLRATELTQLVS